MRLSGTETLYSGAYSETALDRWAQRIRNWARGAEPRDAKRVSTVRSERTARDVFCSFDNDQKVEAPFDARRLKARLSPDIEPLPEIASIQRRHTSHGRAAQPKTP